MTQSRLRVGVIGTGIGKAHLEGYQKLADTVEVVALCDSDETRLNQIADKFDVPLRYTKATELFNSGKVEAVSVCLPNNLHGPVSIAALEAGLHVLCEKPLAENVATGEKIAAVAAKASTKFMLCYNRRYRPDVQWMKQVIEQDYLGEIYQIKAGWVRETGIPGWGGWFTDKQIAGGGPLIDLGVHMLDAALWLVDFPAPLTVSGTVYTNFGPQQFKTWGHRPTSAQPTGYTVEDAATAFIRLADNISLTLEVSWASHARPGMDDFFLTLNGTKGAVELYVANYAGENTLTMYREVAGVPVVTKPMVKVLGYDHNISIAEFVRCVRDDLTPPATAEDGLVVLRIIEAIYNSAHQGQEITLG